LKIIGLLKSLIENDLEVVLNFLIVFHYSYQYAKKTQFLLQRDATYHWLTGAIPYAGKAEIAGEAETLTQDNINQTNRILTTVLGQMERLGYDLFNPKTRFAGSRYSITMADSLTRVNVPTCIEELQGTPLTYILGWTFRGR